MSGIHTGPVLASYRDAVTELMQAGEEFGEVEQAIDRVPDLNEEAKAALWLFAFSMRDSAEQQQGARTQLVALD
jgi:hypothetical protein